MIIFESIVSFDFLAFIVRKVKDHICAIVSSALNYSFDEFREVFLVLPIKFDHHPSVDQVNFDFLFLSSDKLPHLELFLAIL